MTRLSYISLLVILTTFNNCSPDLDTEFSAVVQRPDRTERDSLSLTNAYAVSFARTGNALKICLLNYRPESVENDILNVKLDSNQMRIMLDVLYAGGGSPQPDTYIIQTRPDINAAGISVRAPGFPPQDRIARTRTTGRIIITDITERAVSGRFEGRIIGSGGKYEGQLYKVSGTFKDVPVKAEVRL